MKLLIKNISFIYLTNVILGVASILVIPLILKRMGIHGFATYAIYTSIIPLVSVIDLGSMKEYIRRLSNLDSSEDKYNVISDIATLYLHITMLMIVIFPIFAFIFSNYFFNNFSSTTVVLICGLSFLEIIVGFPINIIIGEASSQEDFGKISIYNIIIGILRYAAMFSVIMLSNNPLALISIISLRRFVELCIAVYIFNNVDFRKVKIFGSLKKSIDILKYSSFLSVAHLFQTVGLSVGTILVNKFFGSSALGIYRSTFDVATRVWFFSNGLAIAIFPRLVRMRNEMSNSIYYNKINLMTTISWFGFLALSIVITVFSEDIIRFMNIPGNLSQNLFVLLCIGVCLNAHANLSYEILQARGEYLSTVFLSFGSLVLLLVIFLASEASMGLMSIGFAWLVSQAIYSLSGDILAVKPNINYIFLRIITLISVMWLAYFCFLR